MSAFFITAISGVTISDDLARGDRFADTAFVTNSWTHVTPNLSPQFQYQVGKLEFEYLKAARLWVYSSASITEVHDLLPYVKSQLRLVMLFLNHLWLVRDNAANCDTGFAFMPVPGGEQFASNVLAIHYSAADSEKNEQTFTREEVKRARALFRNLAFDREATRKGLPTLQKNEQRLERAHYFVQAARAQPDLGLKVGYYCSSLEALFATSPSSARSRMNSRTAWFA